MFTLGTKQNKTAFYLDSWKFNDKLLKGEAFVSGVKESTQKLLEAETGSFRAWWELFKEEAKIHAIERTIFFLKRQERAKEKELQCQLQFLLCLESAQPGQFTKEVSEVKSKLELIDTDNCRGAVIRARAERFWAGETPTKRSLSDTKKYAIQNEIKEIQYGNKITRDKKKKKKILNVLSLNIIEIF